MDLRPSYASTAKFLRRMATSYAHTEAVADCACCALKYAATVLEQLASQDQDKFSVRTKWPRGKTYRCESCGERCQSSDFTAVWDAGTGKPICPGCEATI